MNEKETLGSVRELAPGDTALSAHIARLAKAVDGVGASGLAALDAHRTAVAAKLGVKLAPPALTDLEKKAARIVPRPTAKVRQGGYREYQKFLTAVPGRREAEIPRRGQGPGPGQSGRAAAPGRRQAQRPRHQEDARRPERPAVDAPGRPQLSRDPEAGRPRGVVRRDFGQGI